MDVIKKIKGVEKKTIALAIVLFGCIVALLWSGYTNWHQVQNEDERVMIKVSKIIELPEEIPTIATVTDREKLADQPFFAKAENGDKVIVYVQAGRAYLYRPKDNKIIDMTVVERTIPQPQVGSENKNLPVFRVNNE